MSETAFETQRERSACEAMGGVRCVTLALEADGAGKTGRLGRMTFRFKTINHISQNGTVYPRDVYAMAIDELRVRVEARQVFGALDHPSVSMFPDPNELRVTMRDAAVRLSSVTMLNEAAPEDVEVVMDIINNEHGRSLVAILEAEGNPGISQRGLARFEEAGPDEVVLFGGTPDDIVLVARRLRLITFDVVADPSFVGATDPVITESKHEDHPMTKLNLTQFKEQNPELYQQCVQIGKGIAAESTKTDRDAAIATAIEEKRPELIEEASKPLKATIAERDERIAALESALESMKAKLAELGIVNEQITDEQARSQVASLEADVKRLNGELVAAVESKKTVEDEAKKTRDQMAAAVAADEVRAAFKDYVHCDRLIAACEGITDKAAAMEAAKAKKAEIDDIVRGTKPAGDKDTTKPAFEDAKGTDDDDDDDINKSRPIAAGILAVSGF